MKIEFGKPTQVARYIGYTAYEAKAKDIYPTVLIWNGFEWQHNSTGDKCLLHVHGFCGPIPDWEEEDEFAGLEYDL